MLPRPWSHSAAIGLAFLLLLPLATAPVHADQFLANGDFEAGSDSWSPRLGFSPSACEGRSGGAGGALETSVDEQHAYIRQTVPGPCGDGEHTLSGYAKLGSGALESSGAELRWLDAGGDESAPFVGAFTPGPDYAAFEIVSSPPADAAQVTVRVSITAAASATLCLDDLRLDGPSPPTPTATATQTPTATATYTPAAISLADAHLHLGAHRDPDPHPGRYGHAWPIVERDAPGVGDADRHGDAHPDAGADRIGHGVCGRLCREHDILERRL